MLSCFPGHKTKFALIWWIFSRQQIAFPTISPIISPSDVPYPDFSTTIQKYSIYYTGTVFVSIMYVCMCVLSVFMHVVYAMTMRHDYI